MVYKGSRFKYSKLYKDNLNSIVYLGNLRTVINPLITDPVIIFTDAMRLDYLAYKYYGDSQLDWIILQANPQYACGEDIQPGDQIVIPDPGRVMSIV